MQFIVRVVIFTFLMQVLTPMTLGSECNCGLPADNIVSSRIRGGVEVTPHSYPWVVAFRYIAVNLVFCGGTVVTNMHVVTAGHCFFGKGINEIEAIDVLLGVHNILDLQGVTIRKVQAATIHENYDSVNIKNDICIVTLDSPVEFGDTIVPICMPSPAEDLSNRIGTVLGWGHTVGETKSSNVLLKLNLDILAAKECMQSAFGSFFEPSSMLCAFVKDKDACQGDSGGPLQVFETSGRYVQAGIVSYGEDCGELVDPGVYTNVGFFVDWIREHTQNAETCY